MQYPLNQSQLGIYYASQMANEHSNYTISCLFTLPLSIDIERLRSAVEQAIVHHPHLLAVIETNSEGEPIFVAPDVPAYKLGVTSAPTIQAMMDEFAQDLPFNGESLMRNYLIRTPEQVYLCLNIHHILIDGCGFEALLADISTCYAGQTIAQEVPTAKTVHLEEQQLRQGALLAEQMQWYKDMFGGVENVSLPLPDVTDTAESGFDSQLIRLDIDPTAIQTFAKQQGIGTSIPYTAAFAWTLHIFTGEDDISYTTFYHGRQSAEMRTATMMVRTLPMLHRLNEMTTTSQLLNQTQALIRDLREKRAVGFGEVCAMSGYNAEVSFIYQGRITDSALVLDGTAYHWEYLSKHEPGLKLNMQLQENSQGEVFLKIAYPQQDYSLAWVQQWAQSYTHVLNQLLHVEKLQDLTPASKEQCLYLDRLTSPRFGNSDEWKEETAVTLFEKVVREYPTHIAVVGKDEQYTYQEIDAITDALASQIGEMVRRREGEDIPIISILIPRNAWMAIAPLAVLKAGCAYQPLDASYPPERLQYMVGDAKAPLVITTHEFLPLLGDYQGEVIFIEELKVESLKWKEVHEVSLRSELKADNLMVLLYTSGSTGVPKGVMLSHRGILAYVHFYQREMHYTPQTHAAAYASFGFDANVMDIFSALLKGATLYIIPEEIRLDLEAIGEFVEKNRITNLFMTTQVAQQFAMNYDTIGDLKYLCMGGEKMMSIPLPSGYKLYNLYGPSECSIGASYKLVTHNEKNIPIGLASDDIQFYVVDTNLHRLPIGAPGELLILGRQVGLGYLNQPEKTAQAFITYLGERAYRTGDIVRYRANGELEFVGRRDGQVKIRGFRIELKEVEAIIQEYPGIKDVTVQAFDYPEGGKYIVAYIVADTAVDIAQLQQFIREQKPPYMVPAYTMQLDKIPLNVNQKVDKKALPKPELGDRWQVAGDSKAAPLNVLEQELMEIVDKVIHQRDFDITIPLIYVGLSSIAAMKVASAVYKQYGVSLDVKQLVKDMSLQDIENAILAFKLKVESLKLKVVESGKLKGDEIQHSVPLTGAQKGIYLDWEVDHSALQYNVPFVLQLGAIDLTQLQQALTQVLQAHPALQTQLTRIEDGSVVMHGVQQAIEIEQITSDKVLEADDLREYMRPFQLLDRPLYHFVLVTTPQQSWLLIDINHIVYDGLSAGILLHDLKKALEGKPIEAESYSLLDYAKDEQQLRQNEKYNEAKTYFNGLIDDIDMTHYPDSEQVKEQMSVIAHAQAYVPRDSIEQTCHQLGITANSYFATILSEVLHRITREERLLFTTISNGRNDMKMMETIGMFVQTLIVESTKTKTTVAERMQAMHQQLQQTLSRDYYPFSELASVHHFAPQILYAYQDGVMTNSLDVNGQSMPLYTLDIEKAKVPLSIQLKGNDTNFIIEAEYDQSLYNADDMHHLCQMIAVMAQQAVNTALPMSSLTMTPMEDIPAILSQSYGGQLDYDRERTLVDWVHYYAQKQPDHTAVVDYCSSLSYAELDRRSNLLGHLLRDKGVYKDTIVGIMLPRIKEFTVSLLSIHKAGGAYVPLDSEYPNERLIYMLENSESKVLITTRALAEQKHQEGDFPAPEMIYIEEIDWSQQTDFINFAEKDGLAYMIYTSGSTGKPKGAMLEHRNLMAFASWRISSGVPANPNNQFICHPSFSFDASICDLIIPLFAGSTVHILHEDLRKDLDALADYITTHRIDGGALPTQLAMALINNKDLPWKFIEMGGEKLVPTTPRSYRKINAYGPTEFTCCSSYHIVDDRETDIPIGRPVPNTWSVIVDPDGHLMPWGMPGELCLIGDQIARGYWNLPDKTAQVFTATPKEVRVQNAECRMYHTGDLAKYNEQGQLVYLGRIDHQVKLRGFRIEMGEIEARIATFPNVTAVIAMVQMIGGSQHLVAYFLANTAIDTNALKAYLKQSLTAYMVPDALVQMDTFPLTPNGKIDRKKLPIPQLERSVEYIAPRNELEKQICTIFAQITGTEQVGIKDDFFEIGGSSLLAIKAVIELTNLGNKVMYGDLFKLKTPEALAEHFNVNANDNANGGSDHTDKNQYYQFDDYNYEAIDALLKENHLPSDPMSLRPLGNVLLTGATGYLGMHMLDYLIRETDSIVYCLVRPQGKMSGESRLKTLMVYYLTNTHEELLGTRIHVLEDDITSDTLSATLRDIAIDTIFNCAAMVKHFVVGKEMDEVNVNGVDNLIRLAEQKQARLIHVSTYSTAGFVPATYLTLYNEQQLHIGQCTDNEYIRTKYLSERLMLQAIADGRINGKVMRVGNLMARAEDGEFQINLHSNAFLNNLKSLKVLGQITSDMMAAPIEMSPIDCVAAAIGKLALTPSNMVLFHPFNNHSSSRTVIIDAMREIGYPMELVTPTTFQQSLQAALKDETKSQDMQGIIHYTTNIENGLAPLGATNFYTTQVLLWLNFRWPMTTRNYVLALLKQIDGLAFFE